MESSAITMAIDASVTPAGDPMVHAASPHGHGDSLVALHAQPLAIAAPPVAAPITSMLPVKRKRGRPRLNPDRLAPKKKQRPPRLDENGNEIVRKPRKLPWAKQLDLRWLERRKAEDVTERLYRDWRLLLFKREVERHAWDRDNRIREWELPPHMTRPLPPVPHVERPPEEIATKVEKRHLRGYKHHCACATCHRISKTRKSVDRYVCCMFGCKLKFSDVVEFFSHQLDSHGVITPFCKRVRQELFQQHQGRVPDPPETVYIGMQLAMPWERPTLWTMEQVEHEAARFVEKTTPTDEKTPPTLPANSYLNLSFLVAYARVKKYGVAELQEQYRIALEHYESALVFPIAPRTRTDVISTVGVGRNWMLSPEPENASRARLLKAGMGEARGAELSAADDSWDSDSDDDDGEIVLLDINTEAKVTEAKGEEVIDDGVPEQVESAVAGASTLDDHVEAMDAQPDEHDDIMEMLL